MSVLALDLINETAVTCVCVDVEMGSYDNVVEMFNPFTSKNTMVDVCVATPIAWLWSNDFPTLASCCGLGKVPPRISSDEFDFQFVRGRWEPYR